MSHIEVSLHERSHALCHIALFGLEDVGKHLQVISTGTESLADDSINVVSLIKLLCQGKFWQQLLVTFICRTDESRDISAVELHGATHHLSIASKTELRTSVVVNLHVLVVVAHAKSETKVSCDVYVRLMQDSDILLRSVEQAWNAILVKGHQRSYTLRHTEIREYGLVHVVAKEYRTIGAQPFLTEENTRSMPP